MPTLTWEGIAIALTVHDKTYGDAFRHLELRATEPLPITETGYRSHFIHKDELALWDSPEAFVLDWLNDAARDPGWQARRMQSRQLSLFQEEDYHDTHASHRGRAGRHGRPS